MIKKNRTKKTTHLNCFNTKKKGILDKKTRTTAKINPKKADKVLGRSAIEKTRKEKEISLTLGSQE